MNQNYEKHIIQKYIVAIAFAIIRSKPLGQPLEDYVAEVRNKLDHREDLFQDVSISDSDFANDDEINVNNVFETEAATSPEKDADTVFDDLVNYFDGDNHAHSNHETEITEPVDGMTSNGVQNMAIFKDANKIGDPCKQFSSGTCIKEMLDIFKDINKINENKISISTSTPKNAQTQSTPSSQTYTRALTVDNEITFCSFGDKDETGKLYTQDTELYTVHGYTENFTHISQSQDINIVVPKKLIQNRNSINNDDDDSKTNEIREHDSKQDRNSDNVSTSRNNTSRPIKKLYNNGIVEEYNKIKIIDLNAPHTNGVVDSKSKKLKLSNSSVTKSSDEYSYLVTDILNDANDQKYKETLRRAEKTGEKLTGIFNKSTFSSTSFLNELELDSNSLLGCNKPTEQSLAQQNKIPNVECDVGASNIENKFMSSGSISIFLSTDSETRNKNQNRNDLNVQIDDAKAANRCNCGHLSSGYATQCASRNHLFHSPNEIEERSDTEAPEEIVTFKILEELNRVKNYLNKHDRLSDSGRSSQGSQLSGARINESGFCLFNYLVEYPLIERTLDLAEEVSRVLGEFVDKLHNDEHYPQFVEKILEKAQELVRDIYEEDRSDDLLKKEDQINRLLLLNRSVNVTKFTIERMLPVLQEVHQLLQRKELLELRLVRTENLCYVLDTLEVLLKRYKSAASSQANSQLSQDDEKSLKRSTITEIWRKKWNLSKSDVSEGSFKKRCVFTETSEILNKIIVEGMDGYSLISFAALQCFNSLQA